MSQEAMKALKLVRFHPQSVPKMAVLRQLALYHDSAVGYAYPGINRLARDVGCSRSTVIEHLNDLTRSKPVAVVRKRNQGGAGLTTHYFLPWVTWYVNTKSALRVTPDVTIDFHWQTTKKRRHNQVENKQSGSTDRSHSSNSPDVPEERSGKPAQTVRRSGREERKDYKKANAAYWRSCKPIGSKSNSSDGLPWEPDQ